MADRPLLVRSDLVRRTDSSTAVPIHVLHQLPEEEHFAVLKYFGVFDVFLRRGDLLDDGVTALFGLLGTEADLLGLWFRADQFTVAEAVEWLAERRLTAVQFISRQEAPPPVATPGRCW